VTDSSWDDSRPAAQPKRDTSSARQRKSSNGKAVSQHQKKGDDEAQVREDSAVDLHEHRTVEDVKLTLQRVLEARALLASKLENDAASSTSVEAVQEDASTIDMAREVLAGFRKGSAENGRVGEESTVEDGNGVQDWSASLIRGGLSKPLTAKGSLWRRDLGTVHDLHGLTDQPDIVRKVGTSNRKLFLLLCCCSLCSICSGSRFSFH
jgi:hypothetical protein